MTLYSNKLKFYPISCNKYISDSNYSIIRANNSKYYIQQSNKLVRWQTGFSSVKCAENFLNSHDHIRATVDEMPYSPDDLEWVIDTYGFKYTNHSWYAKVDDTLLILKLDKDKFILNIEQNDYETVKQLGTIDDLIETLDEYFDESQIFGSVSLTSSINRSNIILCAKNSRDIAKNLVRVKSSNIWAYGIEIKDKKDKTGDVVVQFKGKNGGPDDIYLYFDVPVKLWRQWLSAPSKGHFFWQNIRNNFWYRKLTGDKRGKLKNALN